MSRPIVSHATPWHFPTPTVSRLGSGLTVWHFALPGQHVATFELVLPAPLAAEPTSKEGVATVALHTIDEGTASHPDGQIGELLESAGATLHGCATATPRSGGSRRRVASGQCSPCLPRSWLSPCTRTRTSRTT